MTEISPIPIPTMNTLVGYGQLSISENPVALPSLRKHAAGVWAIVGTSQEVAALQSNGPAQTAAVVAVCDSQAVYATSQTGSAITGISVSATGLYGASTSGRGIEGWSTSNYGVSGDSQTFAGVRGTSVNAAGTEGWSTNGAGVLATSQAGDGVYAESQGPNSSGIHAINSHGGNAATFDGNVQINGNMSVNNINVADDILFAGGQDCAEHFEAEEGQQVIPGAVMVIQDSGLVASCSQPYDKRAAGVVTGAGQFRPAMILGKGASDGSRPAIALIGKVCCLVDADLAPVETGDLLTTSTTSGHAMKATDQTRAFGAVIGKALGSLSSGKGLVPMLVCLQ